MKFIFQAKAASSQNVLIFIQDSSSTTGAGLANLVFNSAGLTCYRYRENQGTGATQINLATMTLGTWADGGFVAVDNTNMPGVYEFGIPNASLATGAKFVTIMLKGATNMAPVVLEIELVTYDPFDSVRLGLTGLANAVPGATGGLFIAGTNAATTVTTAFTTTFTGNLTGSVGSVSGHTPQTGDSFARIGAAGAGLTDITGRLPSALTKGTSDSGTTLTMVDAARTEADTDYWKGCWIRFTSGTISGQVRLITAFTPASDTVTFSPATTQAVSTETYEMLPAGGVDVQMWLASVADPPVVLTDILADSTAFNGADIPSILADTAVIGAAGAGLTDLGGMSTTMKAQVNTEVSDVVKIDTISEMAQQAPPAAPTFEEAVMYLYMTLRNKLDVSTTTKSFHNDAGTLIWKKALTDNGTTYSEAEGITGP